LKLKEPSDEPIKHLTLNTNAKKETFQDYQMLEMNPDNPDQNLDDNFYLYNKENEIDNKNFNRSGIVENNEYSVSLKNNGNKEDVENHESINIINDNIKNNDGIYKNNNYNETNETNPDQNNIYEENNNINSNINLLNNNTPIQNDNDNTDFLITLERLKKGKERKPTKSMTEQDDNLNLHLNLNFNNSKYNNSTDLMSERSNYNNMTNNSININNNINNNNNSNTPGIYYNYNNFRSEGGDYTVERKANGNNDILSNDAHFRRRHLETQFKIEKLKEEKLVNEISELRKPQLNKKSEEIVKQLKIQNKFLSPRVLTSNNSLTTKSVNEISDMTSEKKATIHPSIRSERERVDRIDRIDKLNGNNNTNRERGRIISADINLQETDERIKRNKFYKNMNNKRLSLSKPKTKIENNLFKDEDGTENNEKKSYLSMSRSQAKNQSRNNNRSLNLNFKKNDQTQQVKIDLFDREEINFNNNLSDLNKLNELSKINNLNTINNVLTNTSFNNLSISNIEQPSPTKSKGSKAEPSSPTKSNGKRNDSSKQSNPPMKGYSDNNMNKFNNNPNIQQKGSYSNKYTKKDDIEKEKLNEQKKIKIQIPINYSNIKVFNKPVISKTEVKTKSKNLSDTNNYSNIINNININGITPIKKGEKGEKGENSNGAKLINGNSNIINMNKIITNYTNNISNNKKQPSSNTKVPTNPIIKTAKTNTSPKKDNDCFLNLTNTLNNESMDNSDFLNVNHKIYVAEIDLLNDDINMDMDQITFKEDTEKYKTYEENKVVRGLSIDFNNQDKGR